MGGRTGGASSGRRIIAACAGPALIVIGVVVALEGFVFHDRLTQAHPDILTFWLPRFAYLGRSIAAGHIPLWNPYEMAGYRFAADPQGGWLYLTPMALFSTLSPAAAMRAFIVVNPLLAGLGLYGFCRSGAALTRRGHRRRAVARDADVHLGDRGVDALRGIDRLDHRGPDRRRRIPAGRPLVAHGSRGSPLGAFGWSQVATAHLSHGLVMCSVLVVAYLVSGAVADVRADRVRGWAAASGVALFLVMLPLASLAVLLPRIDALQASSLAAGYDRLGDALGSLGGADSASIQDNGVWAAWPLAFGAAPGAYAGAVILLAVPLAVRARRHRALVWGVGGALVLTWVAMLDAVVTAGWFRSLLLRIPFGDVYLHNPGRMRYLAVIAIPILGAVGIQGLRDDPMPARRAALWLGGGAVLWLGVPLAAGATPTAVRAARGGARRGRRRRLAPGHRADAMGVGCRGRRPLGRTRRQRRLVTFGHHRRHGPPRSGGRRASQPDPAAAPGPRGRCRGVRGADGVRPPLAGERRAIPHVGPAGGRRSTRATCSCSCVPTGRRWRWNAARCSRSATRSATTPCSSPATGTTSVRARTCRVFYNAAVIDLPTSQDVGLLGVRYLVVPTGIDVAASGDGRRTRAGLRPRGALDVAAPRLGGGVLDRGGLDRRGAARPSPPPASILPTKPSSSPTPGSSRSPVPNRERRARRNAHRRRSTIDATASAPSIVVVRSTYDDGWTATVDGEPADVVPVDGFLQGVPVSAGDHTIELVYEDEALTRGLIAGAVVWIGIVVAFVLAAVTERRRRREPRAPDGSRDPQMPAPREDRPGRRGSRPRTAARGSR